jgi:hypothetical protein
METAGQTREQNDPNKIRLEFWSNFRRTYWRERYHGVSHGEQETKNELVFL